MKSCRKVTELQVLFPTNGFFFFFGLFGTAAQSYSYFYMILASAVEM